MGSKICSCYVSVFVSAVSICAIPFKEAYSYQQSYVCENIVRFTLSVVNDLLFYLDELKIVWYVFLS